MVRTSDVVRTQQAALRQSASQLAKGTCISVDWSAGTATVNIGGANPEMPMVGAPPIPQQPCWVAFLGGVPVCLGAVTRPPLGTVAGDASGGKLPVTADDGVTYQLSYDPNVASWTAGQRVLINWDGGGTVVVNLSADPHADDPNASPPPVAKPSGPKARDVSFAPSWSGTQTGGSANFWTSEVYCGNTTLGAYGGYSVASSIPDTAKITRVLFYLSPMNEYGDPAHLALHSLASRSGVIAPSGSLAVAAGARWVDLPTSWGDQLKTGATRGIATNHGGYHVYNPAGSGSAGKLRILGTW